MKTKFYSVLMQYLFFEPSDFFIYLLKLLGVDGFEFITEEAFRLTYSSCRKSLSKVPDWGNTYVWFLFENFISCPSISYISTIEKWNKSQKCIYINYFLIDFYFQNHRSKFQKTFCSNFNCKHFCLFIFQSINLSYQIVEVFN